MLWCCNRLVSTAAILLSVKKTNKQKSLVSPGEKEKNAEQPLNMNIVINFMLDPKEKTRSEIKEE